MKRLVKGAALGILLSVGYRGIITGRRVAREFFAVANYTLTCDPLLSESVQKTVATLVAALVQNQTNIHTMIDFLQLHVPSVGGASVRYAPGMPMHLEVSAAKPAYVLNTMHVLTDRATLAAYADYQSGAASELPAVAVPTLPTNKQDLHTLKCGLDKFDQLLLHAYQLTRVSETESWLRDKRQPNLACIINDKCLFDPLKQSYAACIKARLEQEGKFSGQKGSAWTVDFRFENQIILSAEKRGVSYG